MLVFVVIAALFLLFNACYRGAKWPAGEQGVARSGAGGEEETRSEALTT